MPNISMFYGIIIRLFHDPNEYSSPHFHAYYKEQKATINIETCEIIGSNLPNKQNKLVVARSEIHKENLLADWDLAQNGALLYPIDPLR